MLSIYGVYRSRASRNYWMAEELGLPFQSYPVIQARRVKDPQSPGASMNTASPEFAALNPMRHIPVVENDGLKLSQSLAINLHLARKHGGSLAARDLEEEALFGDWTLWAATDVEPNAVRIVMAADSGASSPAIGDAVDALRLPFAALEQHLATRDYLVGDRFTVADLNVAEVMRYAMSVDALFDSHPRVKAWLSRCHDRPAYRKMMASREQEPA